MQAFLKTAILKSVIQILRVLYTYTQKDNWNLEGSVVVSSIK